MCIRDRSESTPGLRIKLGKTIEAVGFRSFKASFRAEWRNPSRNVLEGSGVFIQIWRRQIYLPGEPCDFRDEPSPDREVRFEPERIDGAGWCWQSSEDRKVRTSEELAEYAIRLFLDEMEGQGGRSKFQAFFV